MQLSCFVFCHLLFIAGCKVLLIRRLSYFKKETSVNSTIGKQRLSTQIPYLCTNLIRNCYIGMWILIISLVLLGVIALIAGIIRNKRLEKKIEKGELDRMPEVKEVDAECCGQHEVCERDSLLAAVSKKIEYYDDEELDQFIGRPGNAYTEEETDMFRDVLYTTLDIEVAGWVRSLQLRGIELPDDLKDEVFLIIGERRNGNN